LTTTARLFALAAVVLLMALACGGPTGPSPPGGGGGGGGGPAPGTRTEVLIGAGDIGECGSPGAAATARLIQGTLGEVFLAGDLAYFQGSAAQFAQCFDPHWGGARERWHPVPGNHEYESAGAGPYFEYFGEAAGLGNLGYYRFIAGEWMILMLNSNVPHARVERGSAQYAFVEDALIARPVRCVAAIFHHPLFSSGVNGPNPFMRDIWQLLYDHHVELVVNGHDHVYERFSRQDPMGRPKDRGIRQFTVGTGGASLTRFGVTAPNSATRIVSFGVLKLTLRPDSYQWDFIDVNGTVADTGFTACQ
jgi:hypothetical protein